MGEHTGITWTDHTFNPWWGCTKVSQGCKNCYAETLSARFHGNRLWGVNGDRKIASEATWAAPLRWNRAAAKAIARRRVFCASMADVFERHADPEINAKLDAARARLWALIEATPNLDWLLLTKRPENIGGMVPKAWHDEHPHDDAFPQGSEAMPRNVWLGTSVCGHYSDKEMIANLIEGPRFENARLSPAVLFISYEPAIGEPSFLDLDDGTGMYWPRPSEYISWIIVGGESGPGARPFNTDYAHAVVEYGKQNDVAVFVKQMGSKPMRRLGGPAPLGHAGIFVPMALAHKSGADPEEWPADLRVQQFPGETEVQP